MKNWTGVFNINKNNSDPQVPWCFLITFLGTYVVNGIILALAGTKAETETVVMGWFVAVAVIAAPVVIIVTITMTWAMAWSLSGAWTLAVALDWTFAWALAVAVFGSRAEAAALVWFAGFLALAGALALVWAIAFDCAGSCVGAMAFCVAVVITLVWTEPILSLFLIAALTVVWTLAWTWDNQEKIFRSGRSMRWAVLALVGGALLGFLTSLGGVLGIFFIVVITGISSVILIGSGVGVVISSFSAQIINYILKAEKNAIHSLSDSQRTSIVLFIPPIGIGSGYLVGIGSSYLMGYLLNIGSP